MKKKLTIPDVMTAKEVANLLHRITRLKWTKSVLFRQDSWDKRYCALGQIAKMAGVKDSILRLCALEDEPIPVGRFVNRLLAKQKERGL